MSWENVYENERKISPGIRILRIPIIPDSMSNWFSEEGQPIDAPQIHTLELNRYQCSLHINPDIFSTLFTISGSGRNDMDAIRVFMNIVSRETQNRLETMQPISEGHPVILDRVDLTKQQATYQIVVHIGFWAIQQRDADLGRAVFERTLHECLSGRRTSSSASSNPLPYLDPSTFHREGYDINAEENAHELLKGMLSEKQFELYKLEGHVIVEGTYGRIYKVNKNDMIDVLQQRKGHEEKTYRLCIEPRDSGTICPTDEVIAKIKLIQASEKELHKIGIKWDNSGILVPEVWAEELRARRIRGT